MNKHTKLRNFEEHKGHDVYIITYRIIDELKEYHEEDIKYDLTLQGKLKLTSLEQRRYELNKHFKTILSRITAILSIMGEQTEDYHEYIMQKFPQSNYLTYVPYYKSKFKAANFK